MCNTIFTSYKYIGISTEIVSTTISSTMETYSMAITGVCLHCPI